MPKLGLHIRLKLLPTIKVERKGSHSLEGVASRAGVATGRDWVAAGAKVAADARRRER